MSTRAASWLAWLAWASTLLAMILAFVLASLNVPTSSFLVTVVLSAVIVAFSTVGALVASRRPHNPIGWLFCCGALLWGLGEFTLEYSVYALVTAPGSLPAGVWAAWFGAWARGIGGFFMVLFLLLLFPTGQLPSQRWRVVAWMAAGTSRCSRSQAGSLPCLKTSACRPSVTRWGSILDSWIFSPGLCTSPYRYCSWRVGRR
jgi:hypothetical protein